MIQTAFIAPTSMIRNYGSQGDISLALSHLLPEAHEEMNLYEHIIRDIKLPITLDNGLFEKGEAEDMETLIDKAIGMNAEFVVVPDVLYDREETEANALEASKLLAKKESHGMEVPKLMAVVQANNPTDFIESYEWMVEQPYIHKIGLSILAVPKSFQKETKTNDIVANRIHCLQRLVDSKHKDTHLLGAGSSYRDIAHANKHASWVVSHDSSSAVWNGIQGKRIDSRTLEVEGGKSEVPANFEYDAPISSEQESIIQSNINVVLRVSGHVF